MQKHKRIFCYRRLGVSVSAVVLYCSFITQAVATPHYYQYAEPDGSDTNTLHYYSYASPDDADNRDVTSAHAPDTAKEDRALTYPPLRSLQTQRSHQAASVAIGQPAGSSARTFRTATASRRSLNAQAGMHDNKGVVNIVQTELASAALVSQASVERAASLALAETTPTPLAGNSVRGFATLSPAAGASGQEVEVASASDPSSPPIATMPPIMPLPSSIASPSASRSSTLSPLPTLSVPPLIMPAPGAAEGLSDESKQILDHLPSEKQHRSKRPPVAIDHFHKNALEENTEVKKHEGIGIKISVRRPKDDINQMLENAYESLIAGNQEEAIAIYKQVLDEQPNNKLGLFGLATTYHRAGQIQLARPLYGKLLAIDPHNVEGLNNFLVLLSDEAPSEALTELMQLEQTHPGFSPVPAQVAVIYEKMGQYDKAAEAMTRAIALSPENLKYRYDMAIILDKQGAWADAAAFYQQLITASDRGEKIPTNPEEIQERLTFIRSNKLKGSS